MREHFSIGALLTCLILTVVLAVSAVSANASERPERQGALSFVSHLIYPVGAMLNFVIVRPVHWLADHYEPGEQQKHEGCRGFRPRRGCGRGR